MRLLAFQATTRTLFSIPGSRLLAVDRSTGSVASGAFGLALISAVRASSGDRRWGRRCRR